MILSFFIFYILLLLLLPISTISIPFTPTFHQSKTCPRGQYLTSNSTCLLCPPGFYQDNSTTTSNSCLPCPAGFFFPSTGAQTKQACRRCPINTFSSKSGSSTCKPCPLNQVSPSGVTSCIYCPPGSYIPPNAFNLGPDTSLCTTCPTDTYTSISNSHQCIPCPIGTTSSSSSTSISSCKPCPAGTKPSGFGGPCIPCPVGTFHDPLITDTCTICPPGTFSSKSGMKSCIPCSPGQVGFLSSTSFSLPSCKSCPNGFTTYGFGASFCRKIASNCPSNYAITYSGDCISCPKNYRFVIKSSTCLPCRNGQVSKGGLNTKCIKCSDLNPQMFLDLGCNKKFPKTIPKISNSCPPGSVNDQTLPKGLCSKCPSQTFATAQEQGKCTMCPYETNQIEIGKGFCKSCPPGLVRNTEDGKDCVIPQTNCPPGNKVINTVFGDLCQKQDCPGGAALETAIPTTCYICDPGFKTITRDEFQACEKCRYDEFSDGGPICNKCPQGSVGLFEKPNQCGCKGKYSVMNGIVNGICKKCPPGSFGKIIVDMENNVCEKCPAGTFSRQVNNQEILDCALDDNCEIQVCAPCPAGTFNNVAGSAMCKTCPKGTFSYGVGETECLKIGVIGPAEHIEHEKKTNDLGKEVGINNKHMNIDEISEILVSSIDVESTPEFSPGL